MDTKKGFKEDILSYQLETFLDGVPGSVYWKDKNGVYLGCNNTVILKGNLNSKDDIIGKTDFDVWPEMAKTIRKQDLEVMRRNTVMEVEETIVLKSSETMYFSSVKSPLRNPEGHVIGIMGNSVDITELKLAKQNAEVANQAKTQFLALMSHELRIPLSGIISTASILSDSDFTMEETREFGKIIEKSGNYLLTTIDSILDFAKLEANKFELSVAPINIKTLIDEITSTLFASANEKGLHLTIDYKICPYTTIISDPLVLRLIFNNLIGNAIKYTVKGSVSVSVKTSKRPKNLLSLQISVKDTGIGIAKNKLDFIFDRFSQVETGYVRKTSRQGTGLGLSIVKKLTDILQGSITVKSKVDSGSVFTFTAEFPIFQEAQANCKKPFKNINILTIENGGAIKNYIHDNFTPVICNTAASNEVVNKILAAQQANQLYDVVIFDTELQNPTALQVLSKVKKIKSEHKVLCLLHFPNRENAFQFPFDGKQFDGVIFKPAKSVDFKKQLESVWKKWSFQR
jgi:signal transduction histidine kinase